MAHSLIVDFDADPADVFNFVHKLERNLAIERVTEHKITVEQAQDAEDDANNAANKAQRMYSADPSTANVKALLDALDRQRMASQQLSVAVELRRRGVR